MKSEKYTTCDICGKEIKAQGIGGHKALAHGIVEKVVVKGSDTRVQRPGDYVKNKSNVIEKKIEFIHKGTLFAAWEKEKNKDN